jgi:hypothetical protein
MKRGENGPEPVVVVLHKLRGDRRVSQRLAIMHTH